MKLRFLFTSLVLLFSMLLLISDANAQFGGMGGSRPSRGARSAEGQSGNRDGRSDQRATREPNNYDLIEYRLSLFQEDLKLATNQAAAWQGFADSTLAYAGDLARERARSTMPPSDSSAQLKGLQHVEQVVDTARNRLTALEEVEASSKGLYQILNPEQRALADIRIPTIIAPRTIAPAGNGMGNNLPDLGSGSRPQR